MDKLDNSDDEFYEEPILVNNNKSSFLDLCTDLEKRLKQEYINNKNEIQKLKKAYITDIKTSIKEYKKTKNNKKGINKTEQVPNKLAIFLNLLNSNITNISMTRIQVVKLVYQQFITRGLTYDKDRRILRVNDEIAILFNIPKAKKDIINKTTDPKDKSGLNFYNLQSFIAGFYNVNNANANI